MKINYHFIWTLTFAPLSALLFANDSSENLLGDFGGLRTSLAEAGFGIKAKHILDAYDDISGAPKNGALYFGRLQVDATLDLNQYLGISGATIAIGGIHQYGHHFYNRRTFDVLTNPSTIESRQFTRLTNLSLNQVLMDGMLGYKIGKIDGVAEFGLQEYNTAFMNLELNYVPRIILQPSTGTNLPFHPGEKWGAVVKYQTGIDPNNTSYLKIGFFDTNNYDVYEDDPNGLTFDYSGPLAYALELGIRRPGPATSYAKIGAHWNEGSYPDLSSATRSNQVNNNFVVYAGAGKTIAQFSKTQARHLDGSVMWSYAPKNRNLYHQQFIGLLRTVGPFANRPMDELGIGVVVSFLSDHYARRNSLNMNEEYIFELSYKTKLSPYFSIQPGFQAIRHPKGDKNRDTVYLTTLRTVITF
ncbi:MAG: carbohydrate porin [Opitutales bacterium]